MAVEAKLEFIVGEFGDLVVDCGFPGIEGWSVSQLRKLAEISLLRKKMPVLPRVYAENRKEPYGIKSYSFFMYKQSKRTPFHV